MKKRIQEKENPMYNPYERWQPRSKQDEKSSKHPLSQHWSNAKTSKEIVLKSAEENDKRNTSGLKQQTKQKISPYLLRTPILLFESI
jgi:hypothetical protein